MALALLVAAAGCGAASADPCAAHDGACLGLHVTGTAGVTAVDQLEIAIAGALTFDGRTPNPPRRVSLPVTTALYLPAASGAVSVAVTGWLAGRTAGSGSVSAVLAPGRHQTLEVVLSPPGLADLSLAPADLAVPGDLSVPPDLRPPPDLIYDNARLIFILSARTGNLAPKSALDTACGNAAGAAGLPGSYVAMIAWPGLDPVSFVTRVAGRRVILPNAALVATDDTLFTDNHFGPINEQADRSAPTQICAWTNFDGTGHANDMGDCTGWTDVASAGAFGKPLATITGIWAYFSGGRSCAMPCHVYCVEQ